MLGADLEFLNFEPYNSMSLEELVFAFNTASAQKYYEEKLAEIKVEMIKELLAQESIPLFED